MSQPAPEPAPAAQGGVTAQEAAELRQGLRDLQQAVQELREARSEPERRHARRQIESAEADLDSLARQSGISRQSLERAMTEARRAEQKEELRPIIQELLQEERDRAESGEPPGAKPAAGEGAPAPPDDPGRRRQPRRQQPPPPDEPPGVHDKPHWSQRSVSDWLK